MQMLASIGVHCTGSPPGYEDERGKRGDIRSVGAHEAVKIVWHNGLVGRVQIPATARTIVTDRTMDEQIKSEWKFVQIMHFGVDPRDWEPPTTGHMIKARRHFKQYRFQIERALDVAGVTRMAVKFEDLLSVPAAEATRIAAFIGASSPQNIETMVNAVRPRPPECLSSLLELELFQEQMGMEAPTV